MKPVIVVESGAKTKTIRQFLRGEYDVIACGGHIVDLPKDDLGIDVNDEFQFELEPIRFRNKDKVEALRTKLQKASKIYLATDPDREGEAIAADIFKFCVPKNVEVHRIEFNAIVYPEVVAALENPRQINSNRVEAQHARRSLDRLIGFVLSSISANDPDGPGCPAVGRVQSPAVALVVDREREIREFERRDYWVVQASLSAGSGQLDAEFKTKFTSKAEADIAISEIQGSGVTVVDVSFDPNHTKNPPWPFTTDTLIDAAERSLGFSSEKTMKLAQELYEGVKLDQRRAALITYMRTDSTRVSPVAIAAARKALSKYPGLGEEFYKGRSYQPGGTAQDAHEAVRPAKPDDEELFPGNLAGRIREDLLQLYELIYVRFLCSQMKPAIYHRTELRLRGGSHEGASRTDQLIEEGFLRLAQGKEINRTDAHTERPEVNAGQNLDIVRIWPEAKSTRPPARFREGSLIRRLKELGIGRPSTYTTVIQKIGSSKGYRYVAKRGSLRPTPRGEALCDYLRKDHPEVVAFDYTAHMEESLDRIEKGDSDYLSVLSQEWQWLRSRYETVSENGWWKSDSPSQKQIDYLRTLEKESGVSVPADFYSSREKVSEWIDKLAKKRKHWLRLGSIHETDVKGALCHRFRLYFNQKLPDSEQAFLKKKKMKYKWDEEKKSASFQFQRQNPEAVEVLWGELKQRYEPCKVIPGMRFEILPPEDGSETE